VCRSLKVLCAAPGLEGLQALREASVGAAWELVGGAASLEELAAQIAERTPDVVVVDERLGGGVQTAREASPQARIVALARQDGTDGRRARSAWDGASVSVWSLEEIRPAILGISSPGGPIRS
jgi:hypothetical protein